MKRIGLLLLTVVMLTGCSGSGEQPGDTLDLNGTWTSVGMIYMNNQPLESHNGTMRVIQNGNSLTLTTVTDNWYNYSSHNSGSGGGPTLTGTISGSTITLPPQPIAVNAGSDTATVSGNGTATNNEILIGMRLSGPFSATAQFTLSR